MAKPTPWQALLPILLVQFIGSLGLSIVLPFLIVVVLEFGGNAVVYGVVSATYAAFQLIGAPWLGKLSDRVGRRRILLVSQAGTLLAWLLFALAFFLPTTLLANVTGGWLGAFTLSLPLLIILLARALDGLTGGNVSVATAYLSDLSTPQTRKRNFGWMSASASLGFILGPALAGLVSEVPLMGRSNLLPVVLAAGISCFALFVIWRYLEDSRPPHIQAEQGASQELSLKHAVRLPHIPLLLGLYFTLYIGFNFFYVAFPVHAMSGLGWSTLQLGVFFSVMSGVLVLVEGPLMSMIGERITDRALFLVGGVVLALSFASMVYLPETWLYFSAALFGLGNGLMWPSFVSLLAEAAGEQFQGAVQGLGSSFGSAAAIVGLLAGGVLYVQIGVAVFAISAVAIVVSVILLGVSRLGRVE